MIKEDCLFCKIAKGEIHSATVYEDSHFTVILDVNPATKGHCLIIPKEHFDNIYDLDGETAGKLFALATCIARAMRDALKCDGLNLVQNNGEIAGQTVNHFHLHLIPRFIVNQKLLQNKCFNLSIFSLFFLLTNRISKCPQRFSQPKICPVRIYNWCCFF